MEYICFVPKDKVKEAEHLLKKDDVASRQSIIIRDAKSLEIDESGSFFLVSGSDEGVERAKEILKEFSQSSDNLDLAKNKIKEEEERAVEGFGGIFG